MEKPEFHGLFELVIRMAFKELSPGKTETTTLSDTELVPLDLSYLPYGMTTDGNTIRANSKQKRSAANGDHRNYLLEGRTIPLAQQPEARSIRLDRGGALATLRRRGRLSSPFP